MPDSVQFTCPLCSMKMQLPAATVGRQGSCPGCKQVVMIQPDPPAAAATPTQPAALEQPPIAPPPVMPASTPPPVAPAMMPPSQPPAEAVIEPPPVDPAAVGQPGAPVAAIPDATAVSSPRSGNRKKIILIASAGGGGLLLLVILLLVLGGGGGDQSSPEAVGRAAFYAVRDNDREAGLALLPTKADFDGWIRRMKASGEDAESVARMEESLDENLAEMRDQWNESFDEARPGFPPNAKLLAVVSDYDSANPRINTQGGVDAHRFSDLYVVFEAGRSGDELFVMWLDDGVGIDGRWYLSDPKILVDRLSDFTRFKGDQLKELLKKSSASTYIRVVRELGDS